MGNTNKPDQLQEAVAKALRVLHHACLRFSQGFDPDNGKQVGVYVWACRDAGATPEGVELATRWALKELREWPTAGQFAALCLSATDKLFSRYVATFVAAVDESGTTVMAPPERVRGGRLLPAGDTSGDGSQAPPALPPSTKLDKEQFWQERIRAAEQEGNTKAARFARQMMLAMEQEPDDDTARRAQLERLEASATL